MGSTLSQPPRLTLVVGGARSGKSRHAEGLLRRVPGPWTYIATALPLDEEMRDRIARHRADRGEGWVTVECPMDLSQAVAAHGAGPVLVDCLTLWLTNLMLAGADVAVAADRLLHALDGAAGPVVLVANEVGLGIVPATPLARAFRDEAGRLNQVVAAAADRVDMTVAGIPITVKGGHPS